MGVGGVFGVERGVEKGVKAGAVGVEGAGRDLVVAGELDDGQVGLLQQHGAGGAELGLVAALTREGDIGTERARGSGGGGNFGEEGLCGCLAVGEVRERKADDG